MNVSGSKNKTTSRRLGQRCDVWGNVATFGATSRRLGQRHDVWPNAATLQRGLIFNVAMFPRGVFSTSRRWNPTSQRVREVHFQRRDVEANVATFPRPTSRKYFQKISKYIKTTCIQIYSSQSLHINCHAISPSPRQPRNLKTCNTNASKLKQEKLNLANLKQEKLMTRII